MEGAVETIENKTATDNLQHSNQVAVEGETLTITTDSQYPNQSQATESELTKQQQSNNEKPLELSSESLTKHEINISNEVSEDKFEQESSPQAPESGNESVNSKLQENKEERKQAEKQKAKNKAKNSSPSETKKEQMMTYVKALMGMHYMKNDGIPAEILPGFYLGSIGAAFNKKHLEENKIENILCCCDGVKETYPNIFKYKMLKLLDKPTEDITRYFEEASEFIHENLTNGKKVLVHCFAGKSRSTTIMISYLIKHHGMTVDQAIELIRSKRSVIQPNMGFVAQLRIYEKKLRGQLEELEKKE